MLGVRRELAGAPRWALSLLCAGVLAAAGCLASAVAAGPAQPVRVGQLPPLGPAARDVGGLASATRMHVSVVLKPRDPAALAAYAREVSQPGSAVYHAFLTPEQFAARFGAAQAEVRAVKSSLRAHGLSPGSVTANRLAIPVAGTAGQIEHAFSLSFRRKALPRGRRAVVASAAPALDPGIAHDVQAVVGLSSLAPPKPLLVRSALRTKAPSPRLAKRASGPHAACPTAASAAAAQGAYTADQIASTYRFSDMYAAGAAGQGQTVAIYELEPYDPFDIQQYQLCYGTNAKVTPVLVDGGTGSSGPGSGESALDIENALGLAPAAQFLVYEGPNAGNTAPGSGPYDTFATMIAQDRAHVISVSWGECEQLQGTSDLNAEATLFEEAATQGQSIVSATGDDGSEDCNLTNNLPDDELAVDDPGSQPFVTAVGGTALLSAGSPPSETVWNHSVAPLGAQGGAGGGGVSHAWQMPGYQRSAPAPLGVVSSNSSGASCGNGSGYCREVPDVAADADPAHGYLVYSNGQGSDPTSPSGWQAVGGTSGAAPLWAALLADADSTAACRGSAIGFANPALYAAAAADYGGYLNDVTAGNNDLTQTHGGLYPAGAAYDMASGLGTPKAGALAAALCADSLRVNDPGTQITTLGHAVRLQITTTALPQARLSYFASHLPSGLSISTATGRITGRARRIGTWSSGVAALNQNLALRAAFFTWRVVGAPKVSQTVLTGVGAGRPTLRLNVSAGRAAPQLKTISLRFRSGLRFALARRAVTVRGSSARGLRFSLRVVGGALQLTLTKPAAKIRITIRYGAIRATRRLAADVRGHRRPALTVSVQTVDAGHHGVAEQARIVPRG
jgi:subtilase family serine protease